MSGCCSSKDNDGDSSIKYENNSIVGGEWVMGKIDTLVGSIPKVSIKLSLKDRISSWKVRWGINRMNYRIDPGIYAVGEPDASSYVLVTANYKLSFDMLRRELKARSLWILVLDTRGVNVWCAAGKGTFGTDELVKQVLNSRLSELVSHRTIILPQLGAPGVSAYEFQQRTGFKVIYGPVRASDINEFFSNSMVATTEMRKVNFNLYDRLILIPIELVGALKMAFIIIGTLFLFNLIMLHTFDKGVFTIIDIHGFLGALAVGCILVPLLLPWIPTKSFALKGWLIGLLWAIMFSIWFGVFTYDSFRFWSYIFILPAISAYFSVNFTGSSTYTSFSGVLKEMRIAIPGIILSVVVGFILVLIGVFK